MSLWQTSKVHVYMGKQYLELDQSSIKGLVVWLDLIYSLSSSLVVMARSTHVFD